ncbi:molecular chaperone Hsp90 [Streptomyces sp. H10-C2]|uniref:sacsin N-terminal ATP-binding-like domain-containing protein n=1 Tax=unclassified Streptomyces TaxID=2593676 RepID=UPI0024BA0CD7|nr:MULTISPECIES: molecular chaperone Hsp90 [unclassified Streptomyces]MDJ0345192.1 molecular chaperone Hsp90 [Streptomyces sp. PH10-H1]MDJ0374451.1 molecular chaperone Hsp90 [Streptomyces sp. H10-C2]
MSGATAVREPGGGAAADPFGTGRLRRGVLDAWAASAARFREDANAEEDLALGGYRDRLVVELAQNAADAAVRAGVPGRLRLTLHAAQGDSPPVLAAANTGAPLDAAGVESLSTLRASAKREDAEATVGRFGVGFASVLAVSDEPAVVGRGGGVRWSLAEARSLAAETPGLAEELRRRDGHVPLLRLPFPAEGSAPEGYDTVVVLPLRDGAAEDLAAHLLAGIDDALLLTLPGLAEVVVDTPDGVRTLTQRREDGTVLVEDSAAGAVTRWRVAAAAGALEAGLLADRPVEERLRPVWSVTWAVPVGGDGAPVRPRTAGVVHAPTPTDEPLGLPALLIASFPMDPTRRHAAPGPLTDFLVARAAETYVGLLGDWQPVGVGIVDLVPGPLGKGELDAELRRQVLAGLPRTAFLPRAAVLPPRGGGDAPEVAEGRWDGGVGGLVGEREALRPVEAEVVEGAQAEAVSVLAEVFPTLLPASLERRPELRALGVARLSLADAIDRLAGAERPAAWWRRLYDALAGTDPDRLTGLPVPLADGRTVVGSRQVLLPLPDGEVDLAPLARLGLKVADPDAVHPLLEKLGALAATPNAVLTTPQVRAAVAGSLDSGEIWDEDGLDADELAEVVLGLVRAAGLAPGDEPWLGALALPDDEGELVPAGELVFPGSALEQVLREDELAPVAQELADKWGEQPLTAVGVLATFALVRAADVVLDPDELEPRESDWAEPDDVGLLDAVDVWCEDVLDRLPDTDVPPVATEIVAIRDLDLVDDDAWPQALAMLSRPPLRDAITAPVRVLLPDGTTESVRAYSAWWLRDHPVLDGRRPVGLRAAGGDPLLAGLYDEADVDVDEQVLRALGVRTSVAALLDEPGGAAELLSRLADPDRPVTSAQLVRLYAALADLDPGQVTLPDEVRAVVDGEVCVVDAADALVADSPDLLPLAGGQPLLPVPPHRAGDLAELFQVRRLSEAYDAQVVSEGETHEVPAAVRELLPRAPLSYVEHEELVVAGGTELDWRYVDGVLHAATTEGVAAGLAWAAGQWQHRFELAALLEDPSRTEELATARWFD